ncbi:hypothetical protein FDECE_13498 [Fusarium decemcellulare]|nr:hypothetical protein FDECE_13498 [Fusarium decemcellulare]
MTKNGKQFIEVDRNGSTERIMIDKKMKRAPCIAGRATTCWKAHPEGQPEMLLVIKDSWQYPERDEEGELLREVTNKGVVNVARYYHQETVQIRGADDDIRNNVRGGLDITQAINYCLERPTRRSNVASSASKEDRGIILQDYGKPIYKASSRPALLAAFDCCIKGHESLLRAGLLHRDISINNLMINEYNDNPSWPAFVIDLDLAIKEPREAASGAKGKTGTRAFMAIGALMGEQHSFMHDLESFFWVLFWICIHYDGPDKSRTVPRFDKWNYADTEELAGIKLGVVVSEAIFMRTVTDNFTRHYKPLIPLLNGLRKLVFPRDRPWEREDKELYARIREILRRDWEAYRTD